MSPPQDPLTGLAEAAVSLHELYQSFIKAGFSPSQAIYLCGQYLAAQAHPQAPS